MSVDAYDGTEPDPRCTCRVVQPPCVTCGKPGAVQVCPYSGNTLEALCPSCIPDEPGDNFYEGRA